MANYENGKIYLIRNHKNNLLYVGATTQSLSQRMAEHTSKFLNGKLDHYKIHQAFAEHKIENFYIELLEKCECETIDEFNKFKGKWIRHYDSLNNGYNGVLAGRRKEEYMEDYSKSDKGKEIHKKSNKKYFDKNKEIILENQKVKYTCEICNCEFNICGKSRHEKSQKHINTVLGVPKWT
jgi:hypothetical protein